MTNLTPIKASIGFKKSSANDGLARANAVLDGVYTAKDDYPASPVDSATLKTQIDGLSAAIAAALDGGKKAIAAREHQKQVVGKSLRQIGRYVEENCKDNMQTFLKSGFQPISTTRTPVPPLSEAIRKIVPGNNSGQILVTVVDDPEAVSYVLRWAPLGPGGTPINWTEQPVAQTRPPALVSGLTPGTTYAFQVRGVKVDGYTDWSESVTRICT